MSQISTQLALEIERKADGQKPAPDTGALSGVGSYLLLAQEVVRELGDDLSLQEMLPKFRDLVIEHTGADRAGLVIFDLHGTPVYRELLGIYASEDEAEEMFNHVMRRGLASYVMRTHEGAIRQTNDRSSLLVAPLLLGNRVVGLVSLFKEKPAFFTNEHLELVSLIVTQAVALIERCRLGDLAQLRSKQMATLTQVGIKLSGSLDLAEVLRSGLSALLQAIDFDVAKLFLLDQEGQVLLPHLAKWRDQEVRPIHHDPPGLRGQGATGRSAQSGLVTYVEDVQATLVPILEPFWAEMGMQTLVSIPVRVEGQVRGVISMASSAHRRLDHETCEWLQALADLLGMAFVNAELYGSLEQVVEERTRELAAANLQLQAQIEERTRAHRALQQEKDLVALLMETSPIGITLVDTSGRITFANKQAEQVLGLSESEITQRMYNTPEWHITDYDGHPIPDEELPFSRVMREGRAVYGMRHAIQWPNGQQILLSINGAPLVSPSGEIGGAVFSLANITRQVQARRALQLSEEKWRSLVENAPDYIALVDRDLRFQFINRQPTWASAGQLIGKSLLALFPADDHHLVREECRRVMEHGESVTFETGGISAWYSVRMGPVWHDGQITGGIIIATDITDRVAAENALAETERQQRALLDAIPDLLVSLDRQGTYLKVRPAPDWDPVAPPDQLEGQRLHDVLPPEVADLSMEAIKATLDTDRVQTYEYGLVEDNGWHDYEARMVKSGDDTVLAMVRDITKERQAQQELRIRHAAMDASITPMSMATVDGHLTYVNQAFLDLWSFESTEQVLGKHVSEFYQDSQTVQKRAPVLVQQGFWTGEDVAISQDGTPFEVLIAITMVRDQHGEPQRLMASFLDITARNRFERELAQRVAELAVLNDLGTIVANSMDPKQMLDKALEKLDEVLNLEGGAIYLLDEKAKALRLFTHRAKKGSRLPKLLRQIPLGKGLAGQVALTRQPAVMWTKEYPSTKATKALLEEGIHVTISVPILVRNKVIGVLNGASYKPRHFSQQEITFLATLGAQIGPNVENAHLYRQLSQAHDSLRALGAQLSDTLEMERGRLSRELHDDIGQGLTALKLSLQMIQARADAPSSRQKEMLAQALALVDDILDRVRSLAAGLRPAALEVQGLVPALRDMASQIGRQSGLSIQVNATDESLTLSARHELALYRIAQEALNNVARHARASHALVQIERQAGETRLVIEDDGVGFDLKAMWAQAAKDGHFGLIGMRERAELIGADFDVETQTGEGTRITVVLSKDGKGNEDGENASYHCG